MDLEAIKKEDDMYIRGKLVLMYVKNKYIMLEQEYKATCDIVARLHNENEYLRTLLQNMICSQQAPPSPYSDVSECNNDGYIEIKCEN
jgi:hypothetical protein